MAPMAGASPVALAAAVTNAGAPFLRCFRAAVSYRRFLKLRARCLKFLSSSPFGYSMIFPISAGKRTSSAQVLLVSGLLPIASNFTTFWTVFTKASFNVAAVTGGMGACGVLGMSPSAIESWSDSAEDYDSFSLFCFVAFWGTLRLRTTVWSSEMK